MMARAYGLPIEVMRAFNEILAAAAERIKSRGYFGYVGGDERPVAWSFLAYLPDSPTVLLGGAATLEEYRGPRPLHRACSAKAARCPGGRADGGEHPSEPSPLGDQLPHPGFRE